ncbi:hypothetical protein HCN44_002384 [Aphidius gifuensis]|uniref:Uncharacterized protein n=1 Tax=Aphidius gifuensis TaxID=684658 RepID=A0A835CWU2_APHGI|nr:nodal modulator 1 [Aphidius gifuensis]KAF7996738.1 hypothetical protein HCN44_002384 [Aphidius gifuensis]
MLFKIQLIILSLINLLKLSLSQEPDGVCGFIKNEYKTESLDYSQVEVKLITSSGSTKAKTVALPNGYYFLSLEQKGNYTLKVEPPPGWSFEPSMVPIDYQGDNLCTDGNDINFDFKGFGITGHLTTISNNKNVIYGPAGVKITLYKEKIQNDMIVGETITDNDGVYFFTPIQPGNYIITASHDVWKFDKSTYNVIVNKGNTELPDGSLVVFGFDVSGKVISDDDQPINGVSLILYGNGKFKDCLTDKLSGFDNYLCHVKTNNNGEFKFPSLTNGDYKIIPHYSNKNTKFDVQPSELSFKVNGKSVVLTKNFKITGFTIGGQVLMSNSSKKIPVADAKIYISGKHIATTDKNGYYSIEKIKSGQYTFKIIADNLQFDVETIEITTNSPIIPIIYPSSYKVCGNVKHSSENKQSIRSVIVENSMATFHREINTDSDTGEYCLYLKPDKYQFNVVVNHNEKINGLQFYPLQHTIDVSTMPINNINFSQLKATVIGTIECMKQSLINCMEISVTLKILDGQIIKTINAINGKYEFTNILPGHYELLIDNDIYCWDKSSQKISITSEHAIVPVFKQTGYSVTFLSSHDTSIEYDDIDNKNKKITITLPAGSTRNCVKNYGEYIFTPKGCHIYQQKTYKWNTNNQQPIILSAIEHRHKGRIVVPIHGTTSEADKQHDIKVNVVMENNNNKIIPTIVKKVANQGVYRYTFEFNGKSDTTYIITPISDIIIFNHASIKVIGKDDCNDDVATFNGHVGIIISGSIQPPMDDVTIKIFGNDKNVPVHTMITDKTGKYMIGPLSRTINYTVTADKIGYTITGPDANGVFLAHKLAEIIINVIDDNTKLPLNGVLLSLSGGNNGNYRKNSITNNNGQLVFNSLSPGDYYLRPMMKEYQFDLSLKIIKINEGETMKIILHGNRIAFSAYGIVKALNGEAETGVTIEAICNDKNCNVNQEESITDSNGMFRIRGLEPNFNYIIQLKNDVQSNLHIQRSSPLFVDVFINNNDTHGIEFVVFHPISRSDVSINIKTNKPEYYRTLKIKLCREDQPDTPIYTSSIDQSSLSSSKFSNNYNPGFLIHLPSLKLNNKKYFIQLESTLSKAIFKYNTIPIYFNANESFKGIDVLFNVERNIDNNDMNQSSIMALPLILIVAIAFLKRDNLVNWFNLIIVQFNKSVPVNKPQVVQVAPIDPRADDIIVEQIMNINKRKVKPRKV